MRMVMKFGGTSLADAECIRAAARRAVAAARQGHEVAVVVSAQGHTTDRLSAKALAQCPGPDPRELDACLAAGEQVSAALFALAVQAEGVGAVSLTGHQAGIVTDSCHGNARIIFVDTARLEAELSAGRIAVVTGFQGMSRSGNITTLGRGGSDTTAAWLALWLKADVCRIYTDVEGVYDKDPVRFPDARKFDTLGYGEMLSLIDGGAQVLHRPCVELAKTHGLILEVCSSFTDAPGTKVGDLESSYPNPA